MKTSLKLNCKIVMQIKLLSLLVIFTVAQSAVRREVEHTVAKPSAEVFGEFICHTDLPMFRGEILERFETDVVQKLVLAGIEKENETYTFEYALDDTKTLKVNMWRIENNVFSELKIRETPEGEFRHLHNMVWYGVDQVNCFRVLPEGCVHETDVQDTYVDICEGFDVIP